MILFIQHIGIEGPGTMGAFFKDAGWDVQTVGLDRRDKLPQGFSGIEAVIVLGGPMNAYEEDKFTFLKDEHIFLKKAIKTEIPLLGICLGGQLLAKACGADVKKAKEKEVGWHRICLTEKGVTDPLFEGVNKDIDVFQWHEDTFEIPDGASLLATANTCRNQVFRFGRNAYALQFHIEVTGKIIEDWAHEYLKGPKVQLQSEVRRMLVNYYKIKEGYDKNAGRIYANFSKIIARHKV